MKILNYRETDNVTVSKEAGMFQIIKHDTDLSLCTPGEAVFAYFMREQNIHKRQLVVNLVKNSGCILTAGAMQFMAGKVQMVSNVKGVGDFIGKAFQAKMTGESVIKPLFKGEGVLVTEPTFKHLFFMDIGSRGGLVVEDGMFLACESTIHIKAIMAKSISGAVLGGEGLFNLGLSGDGIAVLESRIPQEELIEVQLSKDEELKVDGRHAVMWDDEIVMAVERSSKSLVGSAASGEGLVNVFRGVGSVWLETTAVKKDV